MNKANTTHHAKGQEPPKITRVIGGTTFEVAIHFSDTSKEGMDDKIMRLIRSESTNFRF